MPPERHYWSADENKIESGDSITIPEIKNETITSGVYSFSLEFNETKVIDAKDYVCNFEYTTTETYSKTIAMVVRRK